MHHGMMHCSEILDRIYNFWQQHQRGLFALLDKTGRVQKRACIWQPEMRIVWMNLWESGLRNIFLIFIFFFKDSWVLWKKTNCNIFVIPQIMHVMHTFCHTPRFLQQPSNNPYLVVQNGKNNKNCGKFTIVSYQIKLQSSFKDLNITLTLQWEHSLQRFWHV